MGKQAEAAKLFEEALRHDSRDFTALLGLGAALSWSGDYAHAMPYFQRAWKAKRGDSQAGYEYAFALGKLNRPLEAEKVLAALRPPTDPTVTAKYYALRGSLAAARKDWAAARQHYATAYKFAPGSFEIYSSMVAASLQIPEGQSLPGPPANLSSQQHFELGLLFASERAYALATSEFREALRIDPSNYSAAFDLVISYRGAGQIEDAIKVCKAVLENKPTAQLYSTLGSLEEEAGRYEDAVGAFGKAVELDPDTDQYRFELGSEYLSHSAPSRALEVFEAGSEKFPASSSQRLGMGLAYFALRQYPAAAEALLRALGLDPSSRTAFSAWNSTTSFFGPSEWKKMLPVSQEFAEAHPASAQIEYCYGVCLFRCQVASGSSPDFKKAQSLLEEAVRLEPRFPEAHLELGNLYMEEKQNQSAVKEFSEALRLDPRSLTARYRLARAYRTLGHLQLAKQELARYEEQYYFELGSEYLLRSSSGQALHEFRVGSQKFPASSQLRLGLGITYTVLHQYSAAADALLRALEIDPSSTAANSAWGSTASFLGPAEWGPILTRLRRLAATNPGNAEVLYCFGLSLFRYGLASGSSPDFKQAQSLLEEAIRRKPRFPEAYLELGNLYIARKDNQNAVKEFREALRLDPGLSAAHYQLAQAYHSLGRPILAEQELALYRELTLHYPQQSGETGTVVEGDVLQNLGGGKRPSLEPPETGSELGPSSQRPNR
jgi:tetratricopeptide (TPR) repeat protein